MVPVARGWSSLLIGVLLGGRQSPWESVEQWSARVLEEGRGGSSEGGVEEAAGGGSQVTKPGSNQGRKSWLARDLFDTGDGSPRDGSGMDDDTMEERVRTACGMENC